MKDIAELKDLITNVGLGNKTITDAIEMTLIQKNGGSVKFDVKTILHNKKGEFDLKKYNQRNGVYKKQIHLVMDYIENWLDIHYPKSRNWREDFDVKSKINK